MDIIIVTFETLKKTVRPPRTCFGEMLNGPESFICIYLANKAASRCKYESAYVQLTRILVYEIAIMAGKQGQILNELEDLRVFVTLEVGLEGELEIW